MTMFPTLLAKMSRLRQRLGGPPAISPAELEDAPSLAALHGEAFRRGWSAEEFERLLVEHNVVADRAMAGARPIDIEIDGGITPQVAPEVARAGANAFVAGSAVFKDRTPESYRANIAAIRNAAALARGDVA